MHEVKSSRKPVLLIACGIAGVAILTKLTIRKLAATRRARLAHLAEGN